MMTFLFHSYAWIVCALASLGALFGAFALRNREARLVTALALFALQDTLLMVYYSNPEFRFDRPTSAKLLPGCCGFILMYIGTMLHRQAHLDQVKWRADVAENAHPLPADVAPLADMSGLIMLVFLTGATAIAAVAAVPAEVMGIAPKYGAWEAGCRIVCAVLNWFTHVFGYVKIGSGVYALYKFKGEYINVKRWLWSTMIVYAICQLIDTGIYCEQALYLQPTVVNDYLKASFAILKWIFAWLFVGYILYRPTHEEEAGALSIARFFRDILRGLSIFFRELWLSFAELRVSFNAILQDINRLYFVSHEVDKSPTPSYPKQPLDREVGKGSPSQIASRESERKWNSDRHRQLQAAIFSAFPNHSALKQMVFNQCDKNLDRISLGANLTTVIFELVEDATAKGWVDVLVRGAHEANPNNRDLLTFYEQYCSPQNDS